MGHPGSHSLCVLSWHMLSAKQQEMLERTWVSLPGSSISHPLFSHFESAFKKVQQWRQSHHPGQHRLRVIDLPLKKVFSIFRSIPEYHSLCQSLYQTGPGRRGYDRIDLLNSVLLMPFRNLATFSSLVRYLADSREAHALLFVGSCPIPSIATFSRFFRKISIVHIEEFYKGFLRRFNSRFPHFLDDLVLDGTDFSSFARNSGAVDPGVSTKHLQHPTMKVANFN